MLIIGHRGAPGLEPENTIRSLKKAQELGCDMVEFDLRRSVDGHLVVSHDRNLKRLFDQSRNINDLTLFEIKKTSGPELEIPTIQEVLENISVPVDIHIKVSGMEQQLVESLKKFSSEVLISSTYPGVLKKIRALDEKVSLGLVIGKGQLYLLPILQYLTRNINLYSIHPEKSLVTDQTFASLKKMNKKILVWTVNTVDEYQKMKSLGVDGIITDHPESFVSI